MYCKVHSDYTFNTNYSKSVLFDYAVPEGKREIIAYTSEAFDVNAVLSFT